MINFGAIASKNLADYVIKQMSKVPKHLIDIVNKSGVKFYICDNKTNVLTLGLKKKEELKLEDGRSLINTSHFSAENKSIILCKHTYDDYKEEGYETETYQTAIHEFAHALDFALTVNNSDYWFHSEENEDIYKSWKNGKSLDWYAALNPMEHFAQAFMAYTNDNLHKTKSYMQHTRKELKQKDKDMYYYLEDLFRNTR